MIALALDLYADPRPCPRVVGATDDGKRLRTCGETMPCPYHGDGALHIVQPPSAGAIT